MPNNNVSKSMSERYLSLDVLRGLTVALMIVVNTPGDWSAIYAPFKHSDWNGFTPTDWVFPTFLFVIGNALSFSMKKLSLISTSAFLKKTFRRTAIIFAIGLFLNAFPFFHYDNENIVFNNLLDTRLWGVMQRIAVCYCIASLLIYYFNKALLIVIGVSILLSYWFILYHFGDQPDPYSVASNAIRKLDLMYLQPKNIYRHFPIPLDPLGLLSSLPAIVNVIAGYLAGLFIQKNGNNLNTALKLIGFGGLLIGLALFWNILFPINKALWTSTYVLIASGYDFVMIAILIIVIEVCLLKKWTYFFEVFGKNPLFIYVMAWVVISLMGFVKINEIPIKSAIYQSLFISWLSPINASLGFAIIYMLLMWLIGYAMDKKKIYIKV